MNNRNIWLSTLSEGDADAVQLDLFDPQDIVVEDAVQLDLFDPQDIVVEDAEDLQDVE